MQETTTFKENEFLEEENELPRRRHKARLPQHQTAKTNYARIKIDGDFNSFNEEFDLDAELNFDYPSDDDYDYDDDEFSDEDEDIGTFESGSRLSDGTVLLRAGEYRIEDLARDTGDSSYLEKAETTFVGFWPHKYMSKISGASQKIVSQDPNLGPNTMKQLIETELPKMKKKESARLTSMEIKDIVREEFYENNQTGLAHLSLCVRDMGTRCLAELVDLFAYERNASFVATAVYVIGLMKQVGLFSMCFDQTRGYYRELWTPTEVNIIPKYTLPPHIQKKIAEPNYQSVDEHSASTLQPCPICGAESEYQRGGDKLKKWHVCCTNPSGTCELADGIPNQLCGSKEQAADMWNSLVLEPVV